tara:strand:+ start:364 stop:498 length:135 start_codon:yes stop_codon:yes gene_type:complete
MTTLKTICYVCNKREAVIIENDTNYICAKCKLKEWFKEKENENG